MKWKLQRYYVLPFTYARIEGEQAEENLALEQARNEDDDLIKLLKQNIEEAKVIA